MAVLLLLIMLVPVLNIQYYFFLPAASFLNAAVCWSICVWILNTSPKRHLPRGFLFRSIHSPPFYACMSLLILVCNFACDLCCFIVNVFSVKSSLELMLYCFIMCRIKIKFSYSYSYLLPRAFVILSDFGYPAKTLEFTDSQIFHLNLNLKIFLIP